MMSPAEMLEALGKPFPKEAVEKRAGGGGRMYDYVATETVIRRLNSATNGDWSFIVNGHEWRGDILIVWGALTIPGLGTRSGYGVQKVAPNAGEDMIKGAASDCLKKCATQFGVALELYGPDLEAGEIAGPAQRAPQRATTAPNAPKPANAAPDTSKLMARLHAVANEHGIDHAGLSTLVKAKGYGSMKDAPPEVLTDIGVALKEKPDDIKAWLAKQGELLPNVAEVPNPDRFTS